jgi:hypothetical protein
VTGVQTCALPISGQWYCHLFAPEQPDLNWDNPEVEADFIKTLRFWADRGVDGFLVDVAHARAETKPGTVGIKVSILSPYAKLLDKIVIDDDHLESIIKNEPCILVAPPHGFFPYGNILTMIVFPCIFGFNMRGIAASMALRVPFIKHLLCQTISEPLPEFKNQQG